jgi:tetratricopeptide (TPR) repeat protein
MTATAGLLERVARLHRHALHAAVGGRPATVERALLQALRLLPPGLLPPGPQPSRPGPDGDLAAGPPPAERSAELALRARVLATLAFAEVELGNAEPGLALLREAVDIGDALAATGAADATLRGVLRGQHGLLLLRLGRLDESAEQLDLAVRSLDESLADDPRAAADPEVAAELTTELASALMNRGTLASHRGDLPAATGDLRRCIRLAEPVVAAKARHNLGHVISLTGDLPAALREMTAAREHLVGGLAGVAALDRARVLHAAGLLRDADAELDEAIRVLAGLRAGHDLAEARLERARVALSGGRLVDARRLAADAREHFAARDSATWAATAELIELYCRLSDYDTGEQDTGPARDIAVAAERLAGELAGHGLDEDAHTARLITVAALSRAGDPQLARRHLAAAGRPGAARIGTRLLDRLTRAELAAASGRPVAADTQLRAGLRELRDYQAGFGSLDLRTAAAVHGSRLAGLGVRRALADYHRDHRAERVLAWSERARAVAVRLPEVRPPADPQAGALLAELRQVRMHLRDGELAGSPVAGLRARRAELERTIRQRAWLAPGAARRPADRPVRLTQVRTALTGPDGGTVVCYLVADARLAALVITAGSPRVIELGSPVVVTELVQRLRADLDSAARRTLPPGLRRAVRASLVAGLRRLDAAIWRPLGVPADGGRVLVVPTGALAAAPWTALAGLRGRAVAVAPSVGWWLAARSRAADGARAGVLLVAGPGVERAEDEIAGAAAAWSHTGVPPATLTGTAATGAGVLAAGADRALLHIAAHGNHQADNPLFSSIELADGPLSGYDLPADLPPHIVLSACDLGLSVVRPGDEPLGMTAALLHGGASVVVAGVGRVADDTAHDVLVGYHRLLAGGGRLTPAQALARALAQSDADTPERPAPLVCFGAGW